MSHNPTIKSVRILRTLFDGTGKTRRKTSVNSMTMKKDWVSKKKKRLIIDEDDVIINV